MDAISVPRNAHRNIFFSWRPDLRNQNRVHFLASESVPHLGTVGPLCGIRIDPAFGQRWNQFSAFAEGRRQVSELRHAQLIQKRLRCSYGGSAFALARTLAAWLLLLSRKLRWPRFLNFSFLAWQAAPSQAPAVA